MAAGTDNTKQRGAEKPSSREVVILSPEQVEAIEKSKVGEGYVVRCLIKTLRHVSSLGGMDDAPPHDIQLEREALSSVLVGETEHAGIVLNGLEESDFYLPTHQELFGVLKAGWQRGAKWGTKGTITDLLKAHGVREMTLVAAEAINSYGRAAYAAYYVKRLKDLSERRRLVVGAKCVVQKAGRLEVSLDELRGLIE